MEIFVKRALKQNKYNQRHIALIVTLTAGINIQ